VLHQFDHYEQQGKLWRADTSSRSQVPGRISCLLAFEGMRTQRSDRLAVPLVTLGGGVVVSPTVKHRCSYGNDGSSWRAKKTHALGCYDQWCSSNDPWRGAPAGGRYPCGFGDNIDHAWHSYDLAKMLSLYKKYGTAYKSPPQFYSGYNELVYGADEWNHNLPNTIESFFVVDAPSHQDGESPRIHRQFLAAYGLDEDRVPLLFFDPAEWDAPFSVRSRHGS